MYVRHMDIAEINNKGPKPNKGDEDILTSHVFGLLEFVRPELILIPWLNLGKNLNGFLLGLSKEPAVLYMDFWSRFLDQGDRTETDIMITLSWSDGCNELIAIEVKYKSGPSGWPISSTLDYRVRGQLGKEWKIASRLPASRTPGNPQEIARRSLVYITPHPALPVDVLAVMVNEVEQKEPDQPSFRPNLYWVCWLDLVPLINQAVQDNKLHPHEALALTRLYNLLQFRNLSSMSKPIAPNLSNLIDWEYLNKNYNWSSPKFQKFKYCYRNCHT